MTDAVLDPADAPSAEGLKLLAVSVAFRLDAYFAGGAMPRRPSAPPEPRRPRHRSRGPDGTMAEPLRGERR